MVEVDVFWAYGLGGTLAAAAGKQLAKYEQPMLSPYFIKTVLFLALIWAPTGMLLLLKHPSWETMQAADSLAKMPPWLVLCFGITNITQGILGFWVGAKLLQHRHYYLVHLNWLAGYVGMFFILLYGWDGLGFDRFLYDRDLFAGEAWTPGSGIAMGFDFIFSSVATTLYIDGIFLIPALLYFFVSWHHENLSIESHARITARVAGMPKQSIQQTIIFYFAAVYVVGFGSAAFMAIVVKILSMLFMGTLSIVTSTTGFPLFLAYVIGLPLSATVLYKYFFYAQGPVYRYLTAFHEYDCQEGDAGSILTTNG